MAVNSPRLARAAPRNPAMSSPMKVGNPIATCNLGFPADLARPRSLHTRLRATRAGDHHIGMIPSAISPASSTVGEVRAPR